jgi:outer membrane receptor protein involved in Fe transport
LSGRLSGVAERRAEPPIIFLNGERITEAQMKALDKETIKSVEVLKGPKAVEKYGPDAVNGVILITLK